MILLAAVALTACEEKKQPVFEDAGQGTVAPPPVVVVADAGEAKLPPAIESFRLADAALTAGKLDEAIARANEATKADPNFLLGWNVLGRAEAAKFEQKHEAATALKAREAFGRALKLDPNFLPAWENLAALEQADGRTQKAAEAWARVLAISPNHPDKARITAFIADAGTH
ncbi:MAG: tetratricopeptide repeat protein [Myxococcaceae bacterium]